VVSRLQRGGRAGWTGVVRARTLACLLIVGPIFWGGPAQAYLDPGTGSYLLQILLAAILGVGVAVKLYWQKIKSLLFSSRAKRPAETDDDG